MEDRKMHRSWTIAVASAVAGSAALAFGLFLAVGRDTLADDSKDKDKEKDKVKVLTWSSDDDSPDAVYDSGDGEGYGYGFSNGEKHAYIGLSLREDTKSNEGGALVERVVADSPAAKAGLKVGDVIVGYGGDIVRGPAKVTEKLHTAKGGDKITLDVRRDGKVQKVPVELADRPAFAWSVQSGSFAPMSEEQQKALEFSLKSLDDKLPDIKQRIGKMKIYGPGGHNLMVFGRNKPLLGVEMVDTTPELREAMGGSKDAGVLVGKVLSGSAAEKGGLKVGDLILSVEGEKVTDAGELIDVIAKHEGKTVDLEIIRDKRPMRIKAVLPKFDEPEDTPTGPRASMLRMPVCAPMAPPPPAPPAPAMAPRALPAPPAPPAPAPAPAPTPVAAPLMPSLVV
jgi:membrane-associated protease RseP (regulator of RpoE activity)